MEFTVEEINILDTSLELFRKIMTVNVKFYLPGVAENYQTIFEDCEIARELQEKIVKLIDELAENE